MRTTSLLFATFLSVSSLASRAAEPILIDHRCTNLTDVPSTWIDAARANLHIAYGHTSHGSQITDGMTGLVGFTGGCGGPQFAWNNGGTGGALDLHDNAMANDVGYYPDWVNETTAYLNNPANSDVNVIIWSWCGQVSSYTEQQMIDRYLDPMSQLEVTYPGVTFVYMTGHVNIGLKANTDARNQQIRDFCIANNKVLYDFENIESYNPDNVYFEYVNDDCSYYDENLNLLGNWAEEWQSAHVEGVDWYNCSSAHSRPLNANQKAYCAWWLWARLAGWPGAPLKAEKERLSGTTGDSIEFWIDAGAANAGRDYALVGSLSGTTPGLLLPGGLATLPLNYDDLTTLTLVAANTAMFVGFQGSLDAAGRAEAVLDTLGPLPAVAIGHTMDFAYALRSPFDFTSNPVAVEIVP
ncbi:MAG: hypothetical protein V2A76_08380 [Planctomycetota bacterium]